jgi:hypothetical protein
VAAVRRSSSLLEPEDHLNHTNIFKQPLGIENWTTSIFKSLNLKSKATNDKVSTKVHKRTSGLLGEIVSSKLGKHHLIGAEPSDIALPAIQLFLLFCFKCYIWK